MLNRGESSCLPPSLKKRAEKDKEEKRKALIKGYKETAEFNLEYAEMCLEADNAVLDFCEEKLSESE